MKVYKINDVISCEFLKIPKAMFISETYRRLSSDAKLAYALLYDRLSLSKLNGWINEQDEVYLIYTREEVAEDLGISYKKAIAAFRELISASLITERRCGRGMPNKIYIVKPELTEHDARAYVEQENARTAESAGLEKSENFQNGISYPEPDEQELPNGHILNCENGMSGTADLEHPELPIWHPNHTEDNKTQYIHTEKSQSVSTENYPFDRRTDVQYDFDEILENCQLQTFSEEERKVLYDALERLFYSESVRVGNAVLPQAKVRSRMYELDAGILQNALDKLHENTQSIRNVTAYVMSTIFNCITEEYSRLHVDPYLNSLRSAGGGKQYVSECIPAVHS